MTRLLLLLLCLCATGAAAQPPGPLVPRPLTGVIDAYPVEAPDGRRVLLQSNRTGRWEIYWLDLAAQTLAPLTDRPGDNVTPALSPDGRTIAFAANVDGQSEIFVMRADGTEIRRLTDHPGDDSHPHWSADGARLLFNSARSTPDLAAEWSSQWHELFSLRADGTDLRQHTRCRSVCTYGSFSPDGRQIVYRKVVDAPGIAWSFESRDRDSEVFVADADGANERNLTRSASYDGWPVWSPDGRWIAFASNRAGPAYVGQVFAVRPDGTGLRQLTAGPWSHVQPSWSADGKRLYVYRNQESAADEFGSLAVVDVVAGTLD